MDMEGKRKIYKFPGNLYLTNETRVSVSYEIITCNSSKTIHVNNQLDTLF